MIFIEQLPVIREQLIQIKSEVDERTKKACALICTPENLRDVKKERAELRKEFNDFENRRKDVKAKILAPYEAFEAVYGECVSERYKSADEELKRKIDEVESALRTNKDLELRVYFDRQREKSGVSWLSYERGGFHVTLSAAEADLHSQVDEYINRVSGDIALIKSLDDCDEVLYEYKSSLDVSSAVSVVKARRAALEAQKKSESERQNADNTEPVKTEEDKFFDTLFEDMAGEAVIFEKPKKEYTIRFELTDDEWRALLIHINGFPYEVIRHDGI